MQVRKLYLRDFLEGTNVFQIPLYQRKYKWTKKECSKLIKDLLNFSKKSNLNYYFLGSIISFSNDLKNEDGFFEYKIVDGQQRLITFALLFKAIYDFIREREVRENFPVNSITIYKNTLHCLNDRDELKQKFFLHGSDQQYFDLLINDKSSDSNMYNNYLYFKNTLKKHSSSFKELFKAISNVNILLITLNEDQKNPHLIYETINSSGVPLTVNDLCKNLLLMNFEEKDQVFYFKEYWLPMEINLGGKFEVFIHHYIVTQIGEVVAKTEVYERFRNKSHELESKELLEDLFKKHSIYLNILNGTYPNKRIEKHLCFIKRFEYSVLNPLILETLSRFEDGIMTENQTIDLLLFLEGYIVRRFVCNTPAQGLNDTFSRVFKSFKKENITEDVLSYFSNRGNAGCSIPKDTTLKENILKPIYGTFKRNSILKAILLRIEETHFGEIPEHNNLTIEHIMPQTITERWKQELGEDCELTHKTYLNTICNLTLTGYNPELSNKSFFEKKTHNLGYKNSTLTLNQIISEYEEWNELSMNDYGVKIVEEIISIWPYTEWRKDNASE